MSKLSNLLERVPRSLVQVQALAGVFLFSAVISLFAMYMVKSVQNASQHSERVPVAAAPIEHTSEDRPAVDIYMDVDRIPVVGDIVERIGKALNDALQHPFQTAGVIGFLAMCAAASTIGGGNQYPRHNF